MINSPSIGYVPTSVGPSKLELFLAQAPDLTEEEKEKVIIITDIARLGKLLGYGIPTTEEFYYLFDLPKYMLEARQHNAQIDWNTKQYHASYMPPPIP